MCQSCFTYEVFLWRGGHNTKIMNGNSFNQNNTSEIDIDVKCIINSYIKMKSE
jgi:hypothetical protein